MTFQKILVPLDGSKRSERALPWARLLARERDIVLLRVIEHDRVLDLYAEAAVPDLISEAERYLHRIASEFEVRPGSMARVGSVVPTIAQVAHESQAEAVVLTTHGTSELTRWVFGSTPEKLSRICDVPLLVVPSWDKAAAPKLDRIVVSMDDGPAARLADRFSAGETITVHGSPSAVLEAATRERADLAIVPVPTHFGVGRWWKSEDARGLLRAATIPLFLVRAEPQPAAT